MPAAVFLVSQLLARQVVNVIALLIGEPVARILLLVPLKIGDGIKEEC